MMRHSCVLACLSALVLAVQSCGDYTPKQRSQALSRHRRQIFEAPPRKYCASGDYIPATRTNTTARLEQFRGKLVEKNLSAYLVPTTDSHQSEYVAEEDKRLRWITGFTGSNGFAVVSANAAAVWVDGRYYIQGEEQLDCNWILMRSDEPETPEWWEWLRGELGGNGSAVIGADPALTGASTWLDWQAKLKDVKVTLKPVGNNLVDLSWVKPAKKDVVPLHIHGIEFAGKRWEDKVKDLVDDLTMKKVFGMVVTGLDEVAWLFNIRGGDIPYSPLFKAYAVITREKAYLYIEREKVTRQVEEHLRSKGCSGSLQCVIIRDYNNIFNDLSGKLFQDNDGKILLGQPMAYTGGASFAIYNATKESKRLVDVSPIMLMKAQKNPTEIYGMENANVKDAVALISFVAMLETSIENEWEEWDELKVSEQLLESRSKQDLFQGNSFETISAYGSNGAIIHYKPVPETSKTIGTDSLLLLDSGGQYLDGTTDVTRTFHFGKPTAIQKEAYTRVMMGSIDLARGIFRAGTTDTRMDILARSPLYSVGLNYRHGTGHGIGAYGTIHESPIQVRIYKKEEHELKVGQFFSDEPGLYIENQFGIRLETVLRVVEKDDLKYDNKGFGPFYGFEPVCLVPFEPKLIDYRLLSKEQVEWLNMYNSKILAKVNHNLSRHAARWLEKRTGHITWNYYGSQIQTKDYDSLIQRNDKLFATSNNRNLNSINILMILSAIILPLL